MKSRTVVESPEAQADPTSPVSGGNKTMRTRRAHAKSHFGCLQCKEKRVKCDEGRPSCNRCTKRGSECTYDLFIHHIQGPNGRKATSPRPKPDSSSNGSTRSRKSSCAATSPVTFASKPSPSTSSNFSYDMSTTTWQLPTPNSTLSTLSPDDYQLYHHYVESVSQTFSSQVYLGWGAWDSAIQENAQTRPFLMSGMLTISAIHLALTYPEQRESYIQTAMRHQNNALREYRPVISAGLKAADYESALGFTALLTLSAFGLQSALFKNSLDTLEIRHADPIVEVRNIIALFRGMAHIYRVGYFDSTDLRLSAAFQEQQHIADTTVHGGPGEHSLNLLIHDFLEHDYQRAHIDMMESSDFDFSTPEVTSSPLPGRPTALEVILSQAAAKCPTDVYLFLIESLRMCLRRGISRPDVATHQFMWAATSPRAFSSSLAVHRPLALVLLAHWAVTLHYMRHTWWADDWGLRLVATCARALGPEWRKYILWPLQEVGLDQDELLQINFAMM